MTKIPYLQRFTCALLIFGSIAQLSASAESRHPKRTDMARMAEELAARLGRNAVSVEGSTDRRISRHEEPRESDLGTRADAFAEALLSETNRHRAAAGLRPLRLNQRLSSAASDRVRDMQQKRYFAHVAPDGTDPAYWAAKRGYAWRTFGENLATGFASPRTIVSGWMRSPGHRANILGDFAELGIAAAPDSPTRRYSGPLVVALYGTAR